MPRGGSKKGEHRGNAKPKDSPNALMRAAAARKPKSAAAGRPTGPSRGIVAMEREIAIAQVRHGVRSADDMTPKQVMLDNMHYFQNAAYQYDAMALVVAASEEDNDDTRRMILQFEQQAANNRRIASDEARNVAPYYHSKFTTIASITDVGHGDDVVKMLFDEIDRKNREHPMVIEHIPQKKTA